METSADHGQNIGLTKTILSNLRSPDKLDRHPWVGSHIVQEYITHNPTFAVKNPGFQLAAAVGDLFSTMIPGAPPKRGIRLDTRWGAFGIMAAQYFAPFLYGEPYPGSLRDAWGKIDDAILLFRFGRKGNATLSDEDVRRYKLIGDEPDVTPMSTISDWHRKGIEDLSNAIVDRERHLTQTTPIQPESLASKSEETNRDKDGFREKSIRRKKNRSYLRWIFFSFILLIFATLFLSGLKAYRIYQLALVVRSDLSEVKTLASPPITAAKLKDAGALLDKVSMDVQNLQAESSPYLRVIGPWLKWVPVYGQDLAASADIVDLAGHLVATVQTSYQAGYPIVEYLQQDSNSVDIQEITGIFVQTQPQFLDAREELISALDIWNGLKISSFSPRTQGMLREVETPLELLDTGLSVAISLPKLLGASSEGPKTYLLLIQNEDEIRPTGGFITSLATFVIKDGAILSLEFEDSGDQEDWSLPYPDAPWQLRQYMNSKVLVLRDANWFPEYPVTSGWVEYLYAYNHLHSVDGIIAFDQQMIVSLLGVIGPVTLEGYSDPISASNVIRFMRESKIPPKPKPDDWYNKAFISKLGYSILDKLLYGNESINWQKLANAFNQMLNERHLLLQFDDPEITTLLADMDMDGAVRPGDGDFFMFLDSNIGFNKTNAAVSTNIIYDVDLTQVNKPAGYLVYSQTNASPGTRSCIQFGERVPEEKQYPIYYCYYNYLRVLVPAGAEIIDATPHQIPADWMILKEAVPARVDTLDEGISGVQAYGTLIVVPGSQTISTRFDFSLPSNVVVHDAGTGQYSYTLKVKKQPGTIAIPITLRVHLPPSANVASVNMDYLIDGSNILIETDLRIDRILTVVFSLP